MENTEFQDFLNALRQGDPAAVEQLDRLYSPFICQMTRSWLVRGRTAALPTRLTFAKPFCFKLVACLRAGRYQEGLQTHEQLEKVLCRMAKNAVCDVWRRERHAGRGKPVAEC